MERSPVDRPMGAGAVPEAKAPFATVSNSARLRAPLRPRTGPPRDDPRGATLALASTEDLAPGSVAPVVVNGLLSRKLR